MSESGSTRFPEGPRLAGSAPRSAAETILNARLIGVPNEVRSEGRAIIIKGEVIAQEKNVLTIRTDRGAIDLQIDPERMKAERIEFKPGQRVEIEIPPERKTDPQQTQSKEISVTIRSSVTARTDTPAPIPQVTATPPRTETQAPPRRSTETPVDIKISGQTPLPELPDQPDTPAPQAPAKTIEQALKGEMIRLMPLPVATPPQITSLPVEILPSVLPPETAQLAPVLPGSQTQAPETLASAARPEVAINQPPALPIVTTPAIPAAEGDTILPLSDNTPMKFQAPLRTEISSAALLPPQGQPTANTINTILSDMDFKALLTPRLAPFGTQSGITANPVSAPSDGVQPQLPMNAMIETIKPPGLMLMPPENTITKADAPFDVTKALANIPADVTTMAAHNLQARLEGFTAQSMPVLSLPVTSGQSLPPLFVMQTAIAPDALAIGTQFQITPQTGTPALAMPGIQPHAPLPMPGYFLTPEPWPVMQDIMQSLQAIAPQAAQNMAGILPSPANAAQMTPAIMFVMAALKGGDLNSLLSEKAIDALRRDGRGHLNGRLSQESNLINRLSGDQAPSTEWRATTLPMVWDGDIHKIALYYKHEREQDNESEGGGGKQTRFLFDLAFNRMGKVQLDGLLRPQKLDLILRTESAISPAMQQQMRRDYTLSLEASGLSGEISFQNKPEQWVNVIAQGKASAGQSA